MGVSFHKIGVMKSSTKEERQEISIEISIIVLHNKDTTTKKVVGGSKNVGNRLPKIGSLFPPELTMELYKYSMLNTNKFHQ